MANPIRRGESGSQVNTWAQNDNYTPNGFTSSILPYGLQLQQAFASSGGVFNITSMSGDGSNMTITTSSPSGVVPSQSITIFNSSISGYNGTYQVGVISSPTSFGANPGPALGTATGSFIASTGSSGVTIPAGITWVYAICVGGGGAGGR